MRAAQWTLSQERNSARRDAEVRVWLGGLGLSFLIIFFIPLNAIFPTHVSESVEMALEGGTLLATTFLLLYSTFVLGKGKAPRPHAAASSSASASSSSISASSSSSSSSSGGAPALSAASLSPSLPQAGPSSYSSAASPAKRRMMTPQYGPENFRTLSSHCSWDEIKASPLPALGAVMSSSAAARSSEWQMNTSGAVYQTSPKEKVQGHKKLDDGRAIPCMPALDYLAKDQLQPRWAENLRKILGTHLSGCLRDFDKASKALFEYISVVDKNLLAKLLEPASTTTVPSTTGMFGNFGAAAAQNSASAAAAAAGSITQEMKQGVRDVIALKVETATLGEVGKTVDLFALADRASEFSSKPPTGDFAIKYKNFKEAMQFLSVLGKGCPLQARTRNLPDMLKELKALSSGRGGLGVGRGSGDRRSGSSRSEDELLMSIFFNYCDVESEGNLSGKHFFTRDYFFPSYDELLKARGGRHNVGIVQNQFAGTFDVYATTTKGLVLLEGTGAVDVILVFLVVFFENAGLEGKDGHEERRALGLLKEIFQVTTRHGSDHTELLRELRMAFPARFPSIVR